MSLGRFFRTQYSPGVTQKGYSSITFVSSLTPAVLALHAFLAKNWSLLTFLEYIDSRATPFPKSFASQNLDSSTFSVRVYCTCTSRTTGGGRCFVRMFLFFFFATVPGCPPLTAPTISVPCRAAVTNTPPYVSVAVEGLMGGHSGINIQEVRT